MGHFSISDLEQLSGVKAHTIRMWEQRYGLLRPVRTATNIRLYCDDDLRRLLNVTTLCGRGQRISQVARLSEAEIKAAVLACCNDDHDHHLQVNALLAAMLGFDEMRIGQLLSEAAGRLGFEKMMLFVAYPLLQRIGLMWLAGTVNPAQEHLLAHLLRQKILAATDALPGVPATARRWVLFLPEGELHELALLFMNYALRARGQHTLYLGQNLPTAELGGRVRNLPARCRGRGADLAARPRPGGRICAGSIGPVRGQNCWCFTARWPGRKAWCCRPTAGCRC